MGKNLESSDREMGWVKGELAFAFFRLGSLLPVQVPSDSG